MKGCPPCPVAGSLTEWGWRAYGLYARLNAPGLDRNPELLREATRLHWPRYRDKRMRRWMLDLYLAVGDSLRAIAAKDAEELAASPGARKPTLQERIEHLRSTAKSPRRRRRRR